MDDINIAAEATDPGMRYNDNQMVMDKTCIYVLRMREWLQTREQ